MQVADRILWVEVHNMRTSDNYMIKSNDCEFAYRYSRWKTSHKDELIYKVVFLLDKQFTPKLDYDAIKSYAGLDGASLSPRVSKFLRDWAVNWNCSDELIIYALEESNKTFSDANKLLKKWANSGIKTPDDVKDKEKKSLPKEIKKSYDTEKVGKSSVLDWARKFADGEENI